MITVTVQATDLLLVLRRLPMGLTDVEQAAADRLRSAANAAAASPGDG